MFYLTVFGFTALLAFSSIGAGFIGALIRALSWLAYRPERLLTSIKNRCDRTSSIHPLIDR